MSDFNSNSKQAQPYSDQQLQYAQFQQQPQGSSIAEAPAPQASPAAPAEEYHFPTHRLRAQQYPDRTPLVLVVCGSFSPITIMRKSPIGMHPNTPCSVSLCSPPAPVRCR